MDVTFFIFLITPLIFTQVFPMTVCWQQFLILWYHRHNIKSGTYIQYTALLGMQNLSQVFIFLCAVLLGAGGGGCLHERKSVEDPNHQHMEMVRIQFFFTVYIYCIVNKKNVRTKNSRVECCEPGMNYSGSGSSCDL